MASSNPFGTMQHDCGLKKPPVIPVNQLCTGYRQLKAEVSGLIIVPTGVAVSNWADPAAWKSIINNNDDVSAKYIAVLGSFTYAGGRSVSIAGGRLVKIPERTYELEAMTPNMATGHAALGRLFESGLFKFRVWLETIENRIIGGPGGMWPDVTDASADWRQGGLEAQKFRAQFTLPYLPATAVMSDTANPQQTQQNAWGNPAANEIWGSVTGWGWI